MLGTASPSRPAGPCGCGYGFTVVTRMKGCPVTYGTSWSQYTLLNHWAFEFSAHRGSETGRAADACACAHTSPQCCNGDQHQPPPQHPPRVQRSTAFAQPARNCPAAPSPTPAGPGCPRTRGLVSVAAPTITSRERTAAAARCPPGRSSLRNTTRRRRQRERKRRRRRAGARQLHVLRWPVAAAV